ncbi:MAG TPA: hypothetical protein DC047_08480 [Blastocatellia bacterium]|nr:hypothetical protein [Blastocatellia bacterium]
MGNYLTNIAVRTLNPAASVRPRLGGRFEPASLVEGSIDNAKASRRNAAKHPQHGSKRDQIVAAEIAEQQNSAADPAKSFNPAPQLDRPAARSPEVNAEATAASPVIAAVDHPSPSLTIRAPKQQTVAESPRQNKPIRVRPLDKIIDVVERAEIGSKTPAESRKQNWPEPPFEESPERSVRVPQRAGEELDATPTRTPSRCIQPALSAPEEQEPVVRPPIRRRQKPLVEREVETIFIRERPLPEESLLNLSSAKSPATLVAEALDVSENAASKTPPALVQSSIAPLIETGPEHLQLNRFASQPQPTIHVTIGRIEVRAIQSSQSPARSRTATPVMNLDDYLQRRSQGGQR